jgi:hypothetical protein
MLTAALPTLTELWDQPKCPPTNKCIQNVVKYPTDYYSAITKDEMMSFAGKWIGLEIFMLSETNQIQRQILHAFSRPKKDVNGKGEPWRGEAGRVRGGKSGQWAGEYD